MADTCKGKPLYSFKLVTFYGPYYLFVYVEKVFFYPCQSLRLEFDYYVMGLPLWSNGQRSRVRFPELPDFLRSSGSGMGSTQPREYN
jgi:hypothetical protein